MIKKFHVLYVGQIELDNVGLNGTPANDRLYSDERLREAFFTVRDVAQLMDELGFDVLWTAEHHFQREGYEVFPNLIQLGLWLATGNDLFRALAFVAFFLNLFNLLPVVPLDGGRITAALHPALWLVGFLGLLGLVIWKPNPILIIILLFSASELWRRWKMRDHPEMQEYYRVEPRQRLIIGVLYFGLAILLVLGMHATHVPRNF